MAAPIHQYNAYLKYADANKKIHIHEIWVMTYTMPFQLSGVEEQSRLYQHFYSRNYAPGDMSVSGRTAHQSAYNDLSEFIRAHHMVLMNMPGANNSGKNTAPLMQLTIPSEGLNVSGIIKSFMAGAKRFNVAPEYTFDLMVINNHYSNQEKITASYAARSAWSGVAIGSAPTNSQSANAAKPVAPKPKNFHFAPPPGVSRGSQ